MKWVFQQPHRHLLLCEEECGTMVKKAGTGTVENIVAVPVFAPFMNVI
jgi:hypothetical protein